MKSSVAAIILAAGASTRLGASKQLLRIGDQSLVRRTVRVAAECGLDPIIVVTGAQAEAVRAELADDRVDAIFNPTWISGIGSSIRCGVQHLRQIAPDATAVVLLVCDQPHLSAAVIHGLLDAQIVSDKPAAACAYAETLGTPCVFSSDYFDAMEMLGDQQGAKKLLLAHLDRVAQFPWPAGAIDIDTPADVSALQLIESPCPLI